MFLGCLLTRELLIIVLNFFFKKVKISNNVKYYSKNLCYFKKVFYLQGSNNVVALNLDFVGGEQESCPNRLVGEDFVNLQNLRFLRVGSVDLDGDFKHLLLNLIWLKWAPLGNFSPINCHLKNLVILDLSYSQITEDWKGWSQIKVSHNLSSFVYVFTSCSYSYSHWN